MHSHGPEVGGIDKGFLLVTCIPVEFSFCIADAATVSPAGRERESSFCLSAPSVSCVLPIHATDPVEFIAYLYHMCCILNLATTRTHRYTHTRASTRALMHTRTRPHAHTHTHTCMHNIHGTPRHHLHGTRMSHFGDLRHVYTTYIPFNEKRGCCSNLMAPRASTRLAYALRDLSPYTLQCSGSCTYGPG